MQFRTRDTTPRVTLLPLTSRAALLLRYAVATIGYLLLCLAYRHLPTGVTTLMWGSSPGQEQLLPIGRHAFTGGQFLVVAGGGLTAAMVGYARIGAERSLRRLLLVSALVLVAVALVAPPILDTDVHAYADVGLGFARGYNPYATPTIEQPPTTSRPFNAWSGIVPVYGPLWLILGRFIAPLGSGSAFAGALVFRVLGIAAVLASAVLLSRLRGVPAAARFVWHPLVIITAVWGAHLDALVLAFILAAALAITKRRVVLAALILGGAIAIKVLAILALPLLLASIRVWSRRILAGGITFGVVALLYLPFCLAMGSLQPLRVLGEESSRGMSNFVWLIPLSISTGVGLPLPTPAQAVGVLNTPIMVGIILIALGLSWRILRRGPSLTHDPGATLLLWSLPFALFAAFALRSFPWYWIIPLGLSIGPVPRSLPLRLLLVRLPLVLAFAYVLIFTKAAP